MHGTKTGFEETQRIYGDEKYNFGSNKCIYTELVFTGVLHTNTTTQKNITTNLILGHNDYRISSERDSILNFVANTHQPNPFGEGGKKGLSTFYHLLNNWHTKWEWFETNKKKEGEKKKVKYENENYSQEWKDHSFVADF